MLKNKKWEQLLTPEIMRDKLISASLFVTAFELLKDSIVDRIRTFYMIGIDTDGMVIETEYQNSVLSRNKSPTYASLNWLIEHEAIDEADIQSFERIKTTRNLLAHDLPKLIMGSADFEIIKRFHELVELLHKIEVWWIVNFEIPTNSNFDGNEIDEDGIVPGSIIMIRMMLEVISGNDELLKQYQEHDSVKKPNS